ncbi:Golgi to ER traffic protein 4 homolog [Ixodes scapularis]|uniref:Golgi to ER traffic protein 4 homolog n=1 Tax=Ixodes scapularis TaxID=6945 RepID=UPI001161892A|nr:Golgi to ER traffic protein 4 homolog [Ixodes scapularis]
MAARVTGTARVLNKLHASIDSGNYYEAHQMYRTIYFRYQSQKKYDELKELLYDGAIKLLTLQQCNSGADLANLLVDILVQSETKPTEEHIERLGRLHSLLAAHSPERMTFLTRALQWSSPPSSSPDAPSRGHPALHRLVALTLWKEKNYQESRYHFVHSTDGDGCAAMLVEFQTTKGYSSEIDLFIAQTVFQYLCLRNPSTATLAFWAYTRRHPSVPRGPPFYLPLLNFLWFLLLAVESRKLAVFTVLCEEYQPTISRDPSYPQYLDKIGQLFFGLPPPPKPQGVFGNLIQTLLGGLEDDDPGTSHGAAGTSPVAQVQPEELD